MLVNCFLASQSRRTGIYLILPKTGGQLLRAQILLCVFVTQVNLIWQREGRRVQLGGALSF